MGGSRSRSRSRSRSPSRNDDRATAFQKRETERERLERERQERMARLRAENEEEEQKLAALTNPSSIQVETAAPTAKEAIIEVDEEELEGLDEEEQMQKLLGFGGFDSTKGKKVEDNHDSLARGSSAKNKARKYRQYMNRKGGFNRPLDKMN